jgi:CPA1 family monovalent cation:H+ antiporter
VPPGSTFVLLFTAATAVALVTRRLRIPYTVALVIAGAGLGALHLAPGIRLTRELLFAVFLPGLVFEASFHLHAADLRANRRAIFALAVPGILVAGGATAAILVGGVDLTHLAPGFGWPHALVFGSLIAATDPIAVVALFKTLGAPRRLTVLVEGESLVNDGTAVVLFNVVYGIVAGGTVRTSWTAPALAFVIALVVGVVVGAVVALVAGYVVGQIDDPMIEITLTVIAAYGSFGLAELLHGSGVIATVTAGVLCGTRAVPRGMKAETRAIVESFWDYIAFALNSIVFLLIGLQVHLGQLVGAWRSILLAFVAVTLGRAATVLPVSALLRGTAEHIPPRWNVVLVWGGLRGALSMVLALALPPDFPQRDTLVTLTFGVVLLSIVAQGLTAGPLLRALKLCAAGPRRGDSLGLEGGDS